MTRVLKTSQATDFELVNQTRAGNGDAFGEIVARYQSLICSLAYSATGSVAQSEDLAQETFVAAWKQLPVLREPEKLRWWLCRISRNLTNDILRQQGREPSHNAESLEKVHETPAVDPLPSDHASDRDEEAILWRSIERIPESYREPLVLYYREQKSIGKVAAALDLTEDAVKQRLSRGRKLLHQQVLSLVEGVLERTRPGKAFTLGVLAALPAFSISARAATFGATAAKGVTTAKATAAGGLFFALLAPILGFVGNYFGYLTGMAGAQSDYEREYIRRFYRKLGSAILGFWATFGLLMIWGRQLVADRHLVYSGLVIGPVLPFTFVLFASGLFWLRAPRKFMAEIAANGITAKSAGPAWEYRSKLALLGLPLIHVRLRSGPTTPVSPVKAWIAFGDYPKPPICPVRGPGRWSH